MSSYCSPCFASVDQPKSFWVCTGQNIKYMYIAQALIFSWHCGQCVYRISSRVLFFSAPITVRESFEGRGLFQGHEGGRAWYRLIPVVAYYSFAAVLFFIVFLAERISSVTKLLVVGIRERTTVLHAIPTFSTQHNISLRCIRYNSGIYGNAGLQSAGTNRRAATIRGAGFNRSKEIFINVFFKTDTFSRRMAVSEVHANDVLNEAGFLNGDDKRLVGVEDVSHQPPWLGCWGGVAGGGQHCVQFKAEQASVAREKPAKLGLHNHDIHASNCSLNSANTRACIKSTPEFIQCSYRLTQQTHAT